MASAGGKIVLVGGVVVPAMLAAAGYAAWRIDWPRAVLEFFTGEGRTTRLILLASVLLNIKCLPLAWTTRIFGAIIHHNWLRPSPRLSPRALFAPMITTSHVSLLEVDYNLHKSNSTYFADMDLGRGNLTLHLLRLGGVALRQNATTKLVLDPATGKPYVGSASIMLGSTATTFKREIPPFARYDMWSNIVAWDRKWLYVVTHFVPRGVARPTEWFDPRLGLQGLRKKKVGGEDEPKKDWSSKVYASAVSRYVFKVGRLTVHPAVVLEASGLLPERPGGWTSGADFLGEAGLDEAVEDGEWTWQRVETARRRGMETAMHSLALDALPALFDGGDNGAIAQF